ncbi:hypothetical protein O181_017093 [Austropuccinia psidii MF-1]|uniref:Aminotransferase class I/classII large domain-containing protein n=1 Tax=Austropuccinia psidii MF-1 TaxID=1389203 RepID=A0A9Q3C5J6_9BASI|nr:hypothetical protein [Austropuccinia psidii MF-1]
MNDILWGFLRQSNPVDSPRWGSGPFTGGSRPSSRSQIDGAPPGHPCRPATLAKPAFAPLALHRIVCQTVSRRFAQSLGFGIRIASARLMKHYPSIILRSLAPQPTWVQPQQSIDSPDQGNHPQVGPTQPATNQKALIDFSSNDYLSLSLSPQLRNIIKDRLLLSDEPLLGPSSSRLLDGNTALHRKLEDHLTDFFIGKSGLLFNTGFDANVGIWSTLPAANDWVLYDSQIHASVHDGLRLSRTPSNHRIPFSHNSVAALESNLSAILATDVEVRAGRASVFVSVESLYSMDGDLCPLEEMCCLLENLFKSHRNAYLIVDEAHSTGLYGPSGRGLVCALSLADRVLIRLHTFGKAAACSGAIVIAPILIRDYLINYARPLIFSTVMNRMNVIALDCIISEFKSDRRHHAALQLEQLCRHLATKLGLLLSKHHITPVEAESSRPPHVLLTVPRTVISPMPSGFFSPIIPILSQRPRELARFLYHKGCLLRPIGTPTVPTGREQVRVCIHASQSIDQIDYLVEQLERWIIKHSSFHHL